MLLKFVIAIVLVALLVSALVNVLASLLSNPYLDSFPRLRDPDDGESDYDDPEVLPDQRPNDRAAYL